MLQPDPLYSSVALEPLSGLGNKSPPNIKPAVSVPAEPIAYLPVLKFGPENTEPKDTTDLSVPVAELYQTCPS